jgi:O-antigen ligase/tetratricopeptide (TPR) repeat protein
MSTQPVKLSASGKALNHQPATGLSQAMVLLIALGWIGCFLLISPPLTGAVSGQRAWADGSLLHQIVDALGGWGVFPTARGVEIKDVIWHATAVLATVLLAIRAWFSTRHLNLSTTAREAWLAGQIMLIGWCALSLLSMAWSSEPWLSLGQATLYAYGVLWALAMGWTLERASLQRVGQVIQVTTAAMAVLTIWYYFERNPSHRPGFPIGNPGPLAAAMVPALLISLSIIATEGWRRIMTGTWRDATSFWISLICAVPVSGAFILADALTAKVALIVGVGVLLWLSLSGKTRWIVAAIAAIAAISAVGYRFAAGNDFSMARGASARLRLYTWRYAAELWQQRPMLGLGAGAYPRLANMRSLRDEQLDPAAFMGTWRNHAHNELFEIFTEIGLVGGVTFVGGQLATIMAALVVLRRRLTHEQRTLLTALLAAHLGLLVDSCGSVSLRLPGFPIVFFTLIGVLWAAGRWGHRGDLAGDAIAGFLPTSLAAARWLRVRRALMAFGVVAIAAVLAAMAAMNALSLKREVQAYAAMAENFPQRAAQLAGEAEPWLLDPTRSILASELQTRAQTQVAKNVYTTAARAPGGLDALPPQERDRLGGLIRQAFNAVDLFESRFPAIGEMQVLGAELAERLANVFAPIAPATAKEWRERAQVAWSTQRQLNKGDQRACLALTRYPALPAEYGVFLRDALRTSSPNDRAWLEALQRVVNRLSVNGVDQVVEALLQAAGPIDPRTDANTIIISMAPEAYRLGAAWWSFRGQHERALRLAGRAVELYRPIRDRFPTRVAITLAEQAEYAFRWQPRKAQAALELVDTAIAELPNIQAQLRRNLERPLREAQARYLIATGQGATAESLLREWGWQSPAQIASVYLDTIRTVLRQPIANRPPTVIPWIEQVVSLQPTEPQAWGWLAWLMAESGHFDQTRQVFDDARRAGVSQDNITGLQRWLSTEFPAYQDWQQATNQPAP